MPRQISKRRAYLLALMTLVLGVYVSLESGDWQWFSRCGSVLVVVGVWLTSSQILAHNRALRDRSLRWEHRLHRRMRDTPGSAHDWANDKDMRSLLRARYQEEETWSIEGQGLYLLILGTLVWGFGDLLGYWF